MATLHFPLFCLHFLLQLSYADTPIIAILIFNKAVASVALMVIMLLFMGCLFGCRCAVA